MARSPYTAFEAEVVAVEDLCPSFRRITFGGPGLAEFGIPFHPLDLRVKLIIPPGGGAPVFDLVSFLDAHQDDDVSWYQAWLQVDEAERGTMRTYTVREWRDAERELVIDLVLHTDAQGRSGPAAQWAQDATVGATLHVMGPSRPEPGFEAQASRAGIEFDPGAARDLLLVGDETAVPAIASILEALADAEAAAPEGAEREAIVPCRGRALLEVPLAADALELRAPAGMEVIWLPREGREPGALLEPAVKDAVLTDPEALAGADAARGGELEEVDVDTAILWEVPHLLTQSAAGSSTDVEADDRPFYAWIAGEAGVVKSLRRYLVREVGVDRRQVAFMGYWREGRAEAS